MSTPTPAAGTAADHTRILTVRVPIETYELLAHVARERDRSIASLVRVAIRQLLREDDRQRPLEPS